MKIVSKYIFIFSLAFCAMSCENSNSNESAPEPLTGGFSFSISESYNDLNSPGLPVLAINIASKKIYGCVNYSIIAETKIYNDKIDISLNGIQVPNICLTALGPAAYRDTLNIPNGIYQLTIHSTNFSSTFSVTITDSTIEIGNNPDTVVQSQYNLLFRYRPNSFAFMCGCLPEDSTICLAFLDTLKSKIDLQEFTFPPNGKIPYPASVGGYYYDAPVKYFYYKSETDFNKISGILKDYKQKYLSGKTGYGIWIQSWMNKYIYSWTL